MYKFLMGFICFPMLSIILFGFGRIYWSHHTSDGISHRNGSATGDVIFMQLVHHKLDGLKEAQNDD